MSGELPPGETPDGVDVPVAPDELPASVAPPLDPAPPAPTPPPPRQFGAARAFVILLMTFMAQFLAGIAVLVIGIVIAIARGDDVSSPEAVENIASRSSVALLLLASVASTVVVLLGARLLAREVSRDRSAAGIGRLTLTRREALTWGAAGAATSFTYGLIASWIVPPDPSTPIGPLAKVASSGGWAFAAWAVVAIVFAPIVEELLFRGLLLRGFTNSWGRTRAAIVVTVLFVAMHLFETYGYWPATVAVTAMAIVTLMARLRTGSLAAAAVAHCAYNSTIALMVVVSKL